MTLELLGPPQERDAFFVEYTDTKASIMVTLTLHYKTNTLVLRRNRGARA